MRLHALVGLMVISIVSVSTVIACPIGDKNAPVQRSNDNDPEFPGGPTRPIPSTSGSTSSTATTPAGSPTALIRVGCMLMTQEEFRDYCASLPR